MKKLVLFFIFLVISSSLWAQKRKVHYKYKKYEKFDFETMNIGGDKSSPGDLSISPRFRKRFKNKIPGRRNFKREMVRAIESVR